MTLQQFAARGSLTPPPALVPGSVQGRIVRVAWLATRFARRDLVSFDSYCERFGTSVRTFRRDIAALRDAGLCVDACGGGYRLVCFRAEAEAA
jgi:predicted DNA-binding transcriptional regulator YafY